jgi:hypothetical protein
MLRQLAKARSIRPQHGATRQLQSALASSLVMVVSTFVCVMVPQFAMMTASLIGCIAAEFGVRHAPHTIGSSCCFVNKEGHLSEQLRAVCPPKQHGSLHCQHVIRDCSAAALLSLTIKREQLYIKCRRPTMTLLFENQQLPYHMVLQIQPHESPNTVAYRYCLPATSLVCLRSAHHAAVSLLTLLPSPSLRCSNKSAGKGRTWQHRKCSHAEALSSRGASAMLQSVTLMHSCSAARCGLAGCHIWWSGAYLDNAHLGQVWVEEACRGKDLLWQLLWPAGRWCCCMRRDGHASLSDSHHS